MKKYITIIDPQGATLGYGGPFVPISHRVLAEKGEFHGFESVQKLFSSMQGMAQVLTQIPAQGAGATGGIRNLTWTVELG